MMIAKKTRVVSRGMALHFSQEIKGHFFPSLIPTVVLKIKLAILHNDGEVAIIIGRPANKVVSIERAI